MKSFLVLTCYLALALSARAADQDNNKKKHAQKEQGQQQVQQQAVIKPKPGKHGVTTGVQSSNAAAMQSQNQMLTKKQQHHVMRTQQNNNLPGAQSTTQVGANAQMQGGKHKFQVKKFNISTSPNSKIATVKFKPGNHIQGSEKWQGQKYMAFKSYQAQKHDKHWWNNHCSRIVIIGGGWYGWNNGFWIPLWGYDDAYSYYPYDGPIAAPGGLDPGQMVANVQAVLQEQGYYQGEVDGLLGPLTRAALAQYQSAHGLYTTAAIDEPTLESLGLV
jgi:Putative peptidoglycan binding domain